MKQTEKKEKPGGDKAQDMDEFAQHTPMMRQYHLLNFNTLLLLFNF